MTAYELFERAYYHYMGQFIGHLWTANKEFDSPKAYISRSFSEVVEEYSVDYAYNMGFKLSYSGNFTNKDVTDLRQIEMQSGYLLCYYDGLTGDWIAMYYDSKSGAKEAYKELYDRYFKHQDWFWVVKIG